MKAKYFKLAILGSLLLIFVIMGCEKNPADPGKTSMDNSSALTEIISSENEILDQIGYDDDGAQSMSYDTEDFNISGDVLNTIKFGRKGELRLESVNFDYFGIEGQPDTMAIATITRKFIGKFIIAEKDTGAAPEDYRIYTKDLENTLIRKAVFMRRHHSGNPRVDWKLDKLSMGTGYSDPTTITIRSVKIVGADGKEYIITAPLDYLMDRDDDLPTFARMDTVKVYVTLSNTNNYAPAPGTTVLLHHGVNHHLLRARRPFNDEGVYPDKTAGDGIYSGYWIVQRRPGVYHAVIDAIDNGTIYDDTAPYNSLGWGTPYRVTL